MRGCRLSKLARRLSEGTWLEGGGQQGLWPVNPDGEQARTLPITLTTSLTTSPLALASVTVAVGLTVPLTGSNMKEAEFEVTRRPSLSVKPALRIAAAAPVHTAVSPSHWQAPGPPVWMT